jgi:hypothetical protein
MAFFIISIVVSFKDRTQQKDGPSATAPEDRRWKKNSRKLFKDREWEVAQRIGQRAKRP